MPTAPSQSSAGSCARSPASPFVSAQQHGHPTRSGAAETPQAEPEPPTHTPTPPCYIVIAPGDGTCERWPVSTAGELRAEIADLVNKGAQAAALSSAVFTAAARTGQTGGADGVARPLITIHGLPAMFVDVLLDSPLDIDPAFVQAHAAGKSYRPLGPRRRRGPRAARYAHWEYPELAGGHKALAAVFCRAGLWAGRDVDVLFLEKPCWDENGPPRKARIKELEPNGRETRGGGVAVARWERHETPSLESILQESLSATQKDSRVLQVLEETVYEQWLVLFEALTPRQMRARSNKEDPLELRILQCLERNVDMAQSMARSWDGSGNTERLLVSPDDWGGLMQRLRTRAEMLAAFPPRVRHQKPGRALQENRAYIPGRRRPLADTRSSQGPDANQRALDRVTYLGGILLPFSIVSGVLSMNESFEPGQPLFWVFWVATIPLTLFTVLVIYADKLRQVEVWAEVLDHSGSLSSVEDDDQKSTILGGGDKFQETEKGEQKTAPVLGVSKYEMDQLPETVAYSAGGDVVIDLGTPTSDVQQMSAEPPLPYQDDGRRDSDQDQGATSSDEDTAGHRPGWRKKKLGWKGAAMCILGVQKPIWVLDGTPAAAARERHDAT